MKRKLGDQPLEREEWRLVNIAGFGEFAVRATEHDNAMLKLTYFVMQESSWLDLRPGELLPFMHSSQEAPEDQSAIWQSNPGTPSVHLRTIIDHTEHYNWSEPTKPADMEELFEQQSLL